MDRQVLGNYLSCLIPAVALPVVLRFLEPAMLPQDLFKIALLYPMFHLALGGLAAYFPKENLLRRSTATVLEHAVLQGMLFAAFLVIVTGFMGSESDAGLLLILRQFAFTATTMSAFHFVFAMYLRRSLRNNDSGT